MVCRNVLIYFDAPLARRVIEALDRSLSRGGVLVLGAADALQRQAARPAAGTRNASAGARPPHVAAARPPGGAVHPSGGPLPSRTQRLAAALDAADSGDRAGALRQVAALLDDDPLDADAHFLHGLVTLEAGDPAAAAAALRRALYTDAGFALAAFTLGRAYDALGDGPAARRAYAQALRTLDPHDARHERMLQQIDIGDIAAACRVRLGMPS